VITAVESVAEALQSGEISELQRLKGKVQKLLIRSVNSKFDAAENYISRLEKQNKELLVLSRLLQGQKKHTEQIIYSIRDAVIVVDEFDKLVMANAPAGRIFGFDFGNSQHKPFAELVASDKAGFIEFLRQSRKSKVKGARKQISFTCDDVVKTFDCIVSSLFDDNERLCGAVGVLHDVTREKEISQMKSDFVSHVSHELKTPLASITAYSEMLVDGEANDEKTRNEFYSIIQSQAQRLSRLIEDILNISRIESGLVKIQKEPLSLTILIEEQLKMIKSYAEEKNIKVIGQKPIVFDQVYVDREMMSQVIINLLSNAVKYTDSGGTVTIRTQVDETSKTIRLSVTDTGVGIPADEVEHVFDKFYRVEANKAKAEGTGLGLNLVKQIVEKVHNGRVFVESRLGRGSTFGFELPLAKEELAGLYASAGQRP
jgi:two-component system phosphate regulon sensor histidine kinase PhoR